MAEGAKGPEGANYSSREINFVVPCILNTTKFVLSHTNED